MHQSKLIGLRILAVRFLAAVVTCGIGLVLSYSWKCFRNPETLRPGLLETAPEMGVELKSGAPVLRAPGAAGNGLTKTQVFPFHLQPSHRLTAGASFNGAKVIDQRSHLIEL